MNRNVQAPRPIAQMLAAALVAAGALHAAPALANAELARAKNCMACHAVDKKLIGPSYRDVATLVRRGSGGADEALGKDPERLAVGV